MTLPDIVFGLAFVLPLSLMLWGLCLAAAYALWDSCGRDFIMEIRQWGKGDNS